jgi:hypothetical protein
MQHQIARIVFALAVGLLIAFLSYRWVTITAPKGAREAEERVVETSRALLQTTLGIGELELVDPLSPDRVVGKAFVYPLSDGWEVSGFYRRGPRDLWHPYLVTLDTSLSLQHLKISDTALLQRNGEDILEVLP